MCAKLAFVASSWLCGMHVKVFHTPKRKFDISFVSKAHEPKGKRKRKELVVMILWLFSQNQTKFGIWVMLPGLARGALQYSTAKLVREGFPFQSRASLSLFLSGSEEENCDFFFRISLGRNSISKTFFFSFWFYAEDSLVRRFSINDDNDDLRVHRQIVQTLILKWHNNVWIKCQMLIDDTRRWSR